MSGSNFDTLFFWRPVYLKFFLSSFHFSYCFLDLNYLQSSIYKLLEMFRRSKCRVVQNDIPNNVYQIKLRYRYRGWDNSRFAQSLFINNVFIFSICIYCKNSWLSVKLVLNVLIFFMCILNSVVLKINTKSTQENRVFVLQSTWRVILDKATFILPCSMYILIFWKMVHGYYLFKTTHTRVQKREKKLLPTSYLP